MEQNLSPGPWRTDDECGDESVLDADGYMVADCAIFFADEGRRGDNVTNARAVAALPALLGYVRASANAGCAKAAALLSAQGMQLREDSRSEAEAEGLQPGPEGMRP